MLKLKFDSNINGASCILARGSLLIMMLGRLLLEVIKDYFRHIRTVSRRMCPTKEIHTRICIPDLFRMFKFPIF